jgi:hypothetical protein
MRGPSAGFQSAAKLPWRDGRRVSAATVIVLLTVDSFPEKSLLVADGFLDAL